MSAYKDAQKNNEIGQTLIEILAALVLLSLLAGSILAVFSPVAHWMTEARQQTTAVNYAASILESLRSEPEKLDESNAGKSAQELGLSCASLSPDLTNEITRLEPLAAYPNLYDVMVTVEWAQGGENISLQLSTIIRRSWR
ncbi:MAG: prepilin-type N-terminal cleavage/methylation domain-containing protein [Syntrophomonas sp.]|jgi:type II secretory pathway pseudopilin PulG|nr:prepilin-type N-terminal cleavage/methylation domain-containing protein [Syntrophomonas sp.]